MRTFETTTIYIFALAVFVGCSESNGIKNRPVGEQNIEYDNAYTVPEPSIGNQPEPKVIEPRPARTADEIRVANDRLGRMLANPANFGLVRPEHIPKLLPETTTFIGAEFDDQAILDLNARTEIKLHKLILKESNITDASLEALGEQHPLTILTLRDLPYITEVGIVKFVEARNGKVWKLGVRNCPNVSERLKDLLDGKMLPDSKLYFE